MPLQVRQLRWHGLHLLSKSKKYLFLQVTHCCGENPLHVEQESKQGKHTFSRLGYELFGQDVKQFPLNKYLYWVEGHDKQILKLEHVLQFDEQGIHKLFVSK